MNENRKGRSREPDHSTSEQAAENVGRRAPTIRARVLAFAAERPLGFIDEDLRNLDPDAPESSYRKRRTELTQDGLIVDSGLKRRKRNGELAIIWCHRKFHPAPPPIVEKAKGKSAAALQRAKREKLMFNALVEIAVHPVCHGNGSRIGRAVSEALRIPFPIRVTDIPAPKPI